MMARTRDSEATQEKILDAAEELFIAKGFSATALRQVAERASVPKSLIFHHFQNKAALWDEVKSRRLREFANRQRALFDQQSMSLSRMTDSIRDYFRLLRDDRGLVQLLARAGLEEDLNCCRFDLELVEQFIQRLRQARDNGLMRQDIQPAYVLAVIVGAITQWFEARKQFSEWPDMAAPEQRDDEYLNAFIDILLHGVIPREENHG